MEAELILLLNFLDFNKLYKVNVKALENQVSVKTTGYCRLFSFKIFLLYKTLKRNNTFMIKAKEHY